MTKFPTCPHCGSPLPTPHGITADISTGRVTFRGKSTRLTPIEFDVFQALLLRYGRMVSVDGMIAMVHGTVHSSKTVENIKVQVSKVRWKLVPLGLEIPKGKWGDGGWTLVIPASEPADVARLVRAAE